MACPRPATSVILLFIPVYSLFIYVAVIYLPHEPDLHGEGTYGHGSFLVWVTPITNKDKSDLNKTCSELMQLVGALHQHQLLPGKAKLWILVEEGDEYNSEVRKVLEDTKKNPLPYMHLLAEPQKNNHTIKGTWLCWLRAISRLKEQFTEDMFGGLPMSATVLFTYNIMPDSHISQLRITRRTPVLSYASQLGVVIHARMIAMLTNEQAFYEELRLASDSLA